MAWTAANLADAVLERLGIKADGQDAEAEDALKVTRTYTSVYAQLERYDIVPFASTSIPEEAQEPLAKLMAGEVATYFGFSGQRLMEIKSEAMQGRRELEVQASMGKPPIPVRARYW